MKSTRASIHPVERSSVSPNQSVQGVSCTKLALLTTNPPPTSPTTPLHTQDESVSRVSALPRHALFQWSGSGWRLSGADYSLGAFLTFPGAYNWLARC